MERQLPVTVVLLRFTPTALGKKYPTLSCITHVTSFRLCAPLFKVCCPLLVFTTTSQFNKHWFNVVATGYSAVELMLFPRHTYSLSKKNHALCAFRGSCTLL